MKPLSDFLNVDEGDTVTGDALALKHAFKKKAHGSKHVTDAVEDDNPYATSTSSSLIRTNTMNRESEDTKCDNDIRYPSMCIVPFFELSRVVRSRKLRDASFVFRESTPDFYFWSNFADILGEDYLDDVAFDWVERLKFPEDLIFQFLTSYIEVCEDTTCLDTISRPLWEYVPGYFLYLQLFFSVFQHYVVRKSSQFILKRNGEDDSIAQTYANACM